MDPAITCCFSGHRPPRLPWGEDETHPRCLDLKSRLAQALERAYAQGYRHFLCGMAQGADLYFGEAVLALAQTHPGVTLEAAIPYEDQAAYWPPADQARRQAILDHCHLETVVQHTYSPGCLHRRNRYMVDHATHLIAVYDGTPQGGTLSTLTYALRKGLETEILEP